MSRANPATTHGNAGIAAWRFKMLEDVHDYETASEVFQRLYMETTPATMTTDRVKLVGGMESKYAYKIGPRMWVAENGETYEVYLYDTPIVRYYPDGMFSVDNGGFNTPTTTERLMVLTPDTFVAFHEQKKLGLRTGSVKLWPLDHTKRIDPVQTRRTGEAKITTVEL